MFVINTFREALFPATSIQNLYKSMFLWSKVCKNQNPCTFCFPAYSRWSRNRASSLFSLPGNRHQWMKVFRYKTGTFLGKIFRTFFPKSCVISNKEIWLSIYVDSQIFSCFSICRPIFSLPSRSRLNYPAASNGYEGGTGTKARYLSPPCPLPGLYGGTTSARAGANGRCQWFMTLGVVRPTFASDRCGVPSLITAYSLPLFLSLRHASNPTTFEQQTRLLTDC